MTVRNCPKSLGIHCLPEKEGGMGVSDAIKWVLVVAIIVCNVAAKDDALWIKWINHNYLKETLYESILVQLEIDGTGRKYSTPEISWRVTLIWAQGHEKTLSMAPELLHLNAIGLGIKEDKYTGSRWFGTKDTQMCFHYLADDTAKTTCKRRIAAVWHTLWPHMLIMPREIRIIITYSLNVYLHKQCTLR